MDTSQEPLAAGLLTALASSVIPTPTSTPLASYSTHNILNTPTSTPGHDGRKGGIHEWSSFIGIATALAGNVLISLALNIQRYAHIRIGREWEHEKVKKETDWKRARGVGGSYGTVTEDFYRGPGGRRNESIEIERPSSRHVQLDRSRTQIRQGTDGEDEGINAQDHMRQSFVSDRTIRPGETEIQHGDRKSYLRSPYWWAGLILMCLGEVGNFLAYGFAPASIVSPLGVVALISNCVIAPFMLKEKFRMRDLWGVLIAIAGAVVVVLSANPSEEKFGPDEIWGLIRRWEFELYLYLSALLIIALMWVSSKHGSRTILIDVGLVALFGGYTALSTKGVSSILSFTLWHIITFPISYLLIFVLVASALMQIRYINRALQRFDSTQVIPTQFVLFTLSVIIGSAVLYRDFESFTVDRAGKFVGGCLLTFLGVYFITSGRIRSDDESYYTADDEEEAIGLLAEEDREQGTTTSAREFEERVRQPAKKSPEARDDILKSPSGSLLSHDMDDIVERQSTPRAAASATPPSDGSLTAESLHAPSSQQSPPLHPHSLTNNPWAESHEQLVYTPKSEPEIQRYHTPPPRQQSSDITPESTVLFRFPSVPGVEGQWSQNDGTPDTAQGPSSATHRRHRSAAHTPSPNTPRNSMSMRFSPGPLLPTLSGGFSAVVAESLRRGEALPGQERRPRRKSSKRKRLSTTAFEGLAHGRDREVAVEDETDEDIQASSPLAPATARLHAVGDLPPGPVSTAQINSALSARRDAGHASAEDLSSLSRLRSMSDSWSGGGALSRIEASLRRSRDNQRPSQMPTAAKVPGNKRQDADAGSGEDGTTDTQT